MNIQIPTPLAEFNHYEKYLPAQHRFTSTLTDEYNLKFKDLTLIPSPAHSKIQFPEPDIYSKTWTWFQGICRDCPPDEKQLDYAKLYVVESKEQVHYQHWTYHKNETYEQLVGDELYDGINA